MKTSAAMARKTVTQADPELTVSSTPANLLDIVRKGNSNALSTRDINIFYVMADYLEKSLKALKERCRSVIIARRGEGEPTGAEKQHREFIYQTPTGNVRLTVQERITQVADPEKLEALLRAKNLWQSALTTALDLDKVDGMLKAGLITQEEYDTVSDPPATSYALIARFDAMKV